MDSFESALSEATTPASRDVLGAIGLVVDAAGKVLYQHASGNQSLAPDAPPVDAHATVTLGSAGKFITHIAALQCVDRKLLGLDDPVSQWLPELDALQIIEPSGLGGSDEPIVERWRASPAGAAHAAATADAHMIVKLFAHPLLFEPGEGRLGEYVQANIFTPLGMDKSSFLPQTREDVLAKLLQMVERTPTSLVPFDGETRDVTVSVRDFGVLFADLIGPASKILSAESINLLFTPQLADGSKALADLRGEKKGETYATSLQLPAPVEVDGVPTLPVWDLEGKGLTLNWTLAGLLVEGVHGLPLGMPPGTVTWNGMPNVVWAMHRERGIALLFATQLIPVDDEKVVKIQLEFFKGAWATYGNAA
ncbi:Protein kinase [Mycena venus]|uniref:Protein kinase n=1 Tax=Mycena venus TaxID=2733690 RepID=A0A8H7CX03_9AGAR|nr:Protein kinase [Mycena venus]